MTNKQVLTAAVTATLALALSANGETIYQTANDASGSSSFTTWNVSGGGTQAPASGNDYINEKYTLRTPNNTSTITFNGKSLQLGASGSSAPLALCRNANSTVTFANEGVKLVNGRVQPYVLARQYTFAGTYDVQATASAPFEFWIADNTSHLAMTNIFTGTLKGSGVLGFVNRVDNPNGYLVLSPADTSNFTGELRVGYGSTENAVQAEFRGTRTMGGKLVLGGKSTLMPQYGTTKWTVGQLELRNGATIGARSGSGDSATITATDRVTIGKNITWKYFQPIYAGNSYNVPFLIKKDGATGELNPQDFKETTVDRVSHECLPRYWFEVTTAANGDETLSYVQPAVTQIKSSDKNVFGETEFTHSSLADLDMIQDGKEPHEDCDYVITKTGFAGNTGKDYEGINLYTPTDLINKPYTFTGKSLTIGTGCSFKSAANPLTIDTLRLTGNSWFYPRVNNATATTLEGREIFIGPEVTDGNGTLHPAMIDVYGNLTWTVKPALTGEGCIMFRANAGSGKPAGTIVLQGLSMDFTGKMLVSATGWDATKLTSTVNECVKVSDARQLGGELATFTADALALENWGTLEATEDVDFSTANRGVTVGNVGQMRVAAGKTLTIGNKVTLNGELHKAGAGRLVLGAASDVGAGAALKVDAGSVQAADAALAGIAVTFSEGTTMAVDASSTSTTGAQIGSVTGTIPVELVYPEGTDDLRVKKVALCTVPTGTVVTVRRPKGYRVVLTSKDNGDGTVTTFADVTKAGLVMILR